jgi:hypothetical protein
VLQRTGKDEGIEENLHGQLEYLKEQEDVLEQTGKDEGIEKTGWTIP